MLCFKEVYWALCHGRVPDEGTISARLFMPGAGKEYRAFVSPRGKEAVTLFRTLRRFAPTDVPDRILRCVSFPQSFSLCVRSLCSF